LATIRQQLTAPESGWKRYDDTHPAIKKSGLSYGGNTNCYNGGQHQGNTVGNSYSFDFIGTKIRLIDALSSNRDANIKVTIDGIEVEYFSTYSGTTTYQVLVYEKTGLSNDRHSVVVNKITNDATYIALDAIDIDSNGRLFHPEEVLTSNELKIGKRIRCHYTASLGAVETFSGLGQETSDFIPPASSATPNGDFYFNCVDYDYLGRAVLVADRNIQHSISWDTLNNAGMVNGNEVILSDDLIPKMTSNTTPEGVAFASSELSGTLQAWNAFHKTPINHLNCWAASGIVGYLGYEFQNPKIVDCISITNIIYTDTALAIDQSPKNFTFEAWDGMSWIVLKEFTNITWKAIGQTKTFRISNEQPYLKYCINGSCVRGNMTIAALRMFKLDERYKFTTRLLTGGILSTDTDNEWNKYIVNSDLNGTIVPGDNNVWNWSGTSSMTSTTISGTPANRVIRGNTAVSAHDFYSSGSAKITVSFRPVLLIETLAIYKYLFQDNSQIKKLNTERNRWEIVGTVPPTEEIFLNEGMDNMSSVTKIFNGDYIDMVEDGDVGDGRQFSCNLVDGMLSVVDVMIS